MSGDGNLRRIDNVDFDKIIQDARRKPGSSSNETPRCIGIGQSKGVGLIVGIGARIDDGRVATRQTDECPATMIGLGHEEGTGAR